MYSILNCCYAHLNIIIKSKNYYCYWIKTVYFLQFLLTSISVNLHFCLIKIYILYEKILFCPRGILSCKLWWKKTRRQQTYRGQQKRLKIRILNPFHWLWIWPREATNNIMLIFRTKYNFCRLPILDCLELKDYVSLIDLTRHKTAIVEKM